MRTYFKKPALWILLLLISMIGIAGTKLGQLTLTPNIREDSLFYVVTNAGQPDGGRAIRATNLITALSAMSTWPAGNQTIVTNFSTTNAIRFGLFYDKNANVFRFFGLEQGSNIVLYHNGSNVVINSSASGSGSSEVGQAGITNASFVALFHSKAGITNFLRSLSAGAGISLTNQGTNIAIALSSAALQNISATGVSPGATNSGFYVGANSGFGTNESFVGSFVASNGPVQIGVGLFGPAWTFTNYYESTIRGNLHIQNDSSGINGNMDASQIKLTYGIATGSVVAISTSTNLTGLTIGSGLVSTGGVLAVTVGSQGQPGNITLTNLSGSGVTPAATNQSAYISASSGRGTNTTIVGQLDATNGNVKFGLFGGPVGFFTNAYYQAQRGQWEMFDSGQITRIRDGAAFSIENGSSMSLGAALGDTATYMLVGTNDYIASGGTDSGESNRYRFLSDITGNYANWVQRWQDVSNHVTLFYDPAAQDYIARASVTNLNARYRINGFVKSMRRAGLWTSVVDVVSFYQDQQQPTLGSNYVSFKSALSVLTTNKPIVSRLGLSVSSGIDFIGYSIADWRTGTVAAVIRVETNLTGFAKVLAFDDVTTSANEISVYYDDGSGHGGFAQVLTKFNNNFDPNLPSFIPTDGTQGAFQYDPIRHTLSFDVNNQKNAHAYTDGILTETINTVTNFPSTALTRFTVGTSANAGTYAASGYPYTLGAVVILNRVLSSDEHAELEKCLIWLEPITEHWVVEGDSLAYNNYLLWSNDFPHQLTKFTSNQVIIHQIAGTGDSAMRMLTQTNEWTKYAPGRYGIERSVFILSAGANDILVNTNGATTWGYYNQLISLAAARGFDTVAMTIPYATGYTNGQLAEVTNFNASLLFSPASYNRLIRRDLLSPVTNSTDYINPLHMSAAGYYKVAREIFAQLKNPRDALIQGSYPTNMPTQGQVLKWNTNGFTAWADDNNSGAGGGSPAVGFDNQIQYVSNGLNQSSTKFTYDNTNSLMTARVAGNNTPAIAVVDTTSNFFANYVTPRGLLSTNSSLLLQANYTTNAWSVVFNTGDFKPVTDGRQAIGAATERIKAFYPYPQNPLIDGTNIILNGDRGHWFIFNPWTGTNYAYRFTNMAVGASIQIDSFVTNGATVRIDADTSAVPATWYRGINTNSGAPTIASNAFSTIIMSRPDTNALSTNVFVITRDLELVFDSATLSASTNLASGQVTLSVVGGPGGGGNSQYITNGHLQEITTNNGAMARRVMVLSSDGVFNGTNEHYVTNLTANLTVTLTNLQNGTEYSLTVSNPAQYSVTIANLPATAWVEHPYAAGGAATNGITQFKFQRTGTLTNAYDRGRLLQITNGANITITTNAEQLVISSTGGSGSTNNVIEADGNIIITNQVLYYTLDQYNGSNGVTASTLTKNWDMSLSTFKNVTNFVGTNLVFNISNVLAGESLITTFVGIGGYSNTIAFASTSGTNLTFLNWATNGNYDIQVRPGSYYTVQMYADRQSNVCVWVSSNDPYVPVSSVWHYAVNSGISNLVATNLVFQAGRGNSNAWAPGRIFWANDVKTNHSGDGTFTNLQTYIVPGNTLSNKGDSVTFTMKGNFAAATATTNDLQAKYGSTTFLDTGFVTASNCTWEAVIDIERNNNGSQRIYSKIDWIVNGAAGVQNNGTLSTWRTNSVTAEVNGVTNIFAFRCASRTASTITNDLFYVDYFAAPK